MTKKPKKKMVNKLKKEILKNANIDPLYKNCSFNNFDQSVLNNENLKPYKKIKNYAKNIDKAIKKPQSLYILSKYPGIGKTHLSVAILRYAAHKIAEREYEENEIVQYGINRRTTTWTPVYFINVSEGLQDIKNDFNDNDMDFKQSEIFNRVKNAQLVVLDDIFNEIRYTPFIMETIFYWVDYRLKNNLATIFTSNNTYEIFLKNESSPIDNERVRTVARNTASRVGKMVKNNRVAFESSPETDYRQK